MRCSPVRRTRPRETRSWFRCPKTSDPCGGTRGWWTGVSAERFPISSPRAFARAPSARRRCFPAGEDSGPGGCSCSRQRPADPAHAQDAEPLAVELDAQQLRRRPAGPGAVAHHRIALARAPRGGQKQQHGGIGAGLTEHVRGMGDHQPARPRRVEVDVIEPHRQRAENPHAGGKARDLVRVEPFDRADEQSVGAFRRGDEGGRVVQPVVRVEPRPVVPGEAPFDGVGEPAGRQDRGFFGHR